MLRTTETCKAKCGKLALPYRVNSVARTQPLSFPATLGHYFLICKMQITTLEGTITQKNKGDACKTSITVFTHNRPLKMIIITWGSELTGATLSSSLSPFRKSSKEPYNES